MSDLGSKATAGRRLADLTPAQRALLEQRLMTRRTQVARESRIAPRNGGGPAPISYSQELLWLLSQVFDDGIAYNAPGAFQLEGPLDLGALARAPEGITKHPDILHTN